MTPEVEELLGLIESTANLMRGMAMFDRQVPKHASRLWTKEQI